MQRPSPHRRAVPQPQLNLAKQFSSNISLEITSSPANATSKSLFRDCLAYKSYGLYDGIKGHCSERLKNSDARACFLRYNMARFGMILMIVVPLLLSLLFALVVVLILVFIVFVLPSDALSTQMAGTIAVFTSSFMSAYHTHCTPLLFYFNDSHRRSAGFQNDDIAGFENDGSGQRLDHWVLLLVIFTSLAAGHDRSVAQGRSFTPHPVSTSGRVLPRLTISLFKEAI